MNEAKQKAQELVKEFKSKKLAKLCCDEILDSRPSSPCEFGLVDWAQWEQAKEFWQSVKTEINLI